jgi:tellurite resistance protein TerC
MATSIWFWIVFTAFVLLLLVLDLGVFHRKAHAIRVREAALWSAFWIGLALLFNAGVWYVAGAETALQFLAGYLVEKSLSVDNIFVFVVIFSYFRVPAEYQHRVLFWGILGALVMRGLFIGIGAVMLARFDWIIYIFGAILLYTAFKLATNDEPPIDPADSRVVRWTRAILPFTGRLHGARFFTVEDGRRVATPLFLVLVLVEFSDIIFAVDSIPAIFAITRDPFVVFTSNVFAILGLRALYFVLAGVIGRFYLLHYGLAVILGFIGVKMLLSDVYHVPIGISLGVIAVTLAVTIVLSLRYPKRDSKSVAEPAPVEADGDSGREDARPKDRRARPVRARRP